MSLNGGVELGRNRVVHDADPGYEFVDEGKGDADVGVSVDKVCGAVDGVDDEGGVGSEVGPSWHVGFFTEESSRVVC